MKTRKNTMLYTITGLALALSPQLATAGGDAAAGKEKAQVCQACHGPVGKSVDPSYPNLAGQHESYLVKALADYRSGRRSNAVMKGFAANLGDQDILDLAKWFSIQDGLKDLSIK
jgi:cytochrome c553